MRTTLDIDDDVLTVAKHIAQLKHKSTGTVVSELLRQCLLPTDNLENIRNGVPIFPIKADAKLVTMDHINQLRDEDSSYLPHNT
ncbi:MAG: CopG family transcriptional regulator [Deltaproteobacteria bacterium]|nr:CopG family transcriptional regulator [Deltaproteobacteria bacterium]